MGRALTVCFVISMAGLASIIAGLWLIWPPLSLLFGGVWLMTVAWGVWKHAEEKYAKTQKCNGQAQESCPL